MASSFEKYVNFKRAPFYVLQGKIPEKMIAADWMKMELDEDPPELEVMLNDLIFPGNFRRMVDSPFDLPEEVEHGAIHCTKQGMIFVGVNEAWIMLGSAIARYKQ